MGAKRPFDRSRPMSPVGRRRHWTTIRWRRLPHAQICCDSGKERYGTEAVRQERAIYGAEATAAFAMRWNPASRQVESVRGGEARCAASRLEQIEPRIHLE
jgi:hypothetical protein